MPRSDHSAFLTGSPFARLAWLALSVAGAALALGCTPKIGDQCTVSTNCSAAGDRLCDITQPGGYCTVFNCEPGTCPADSVCINFGTSLSSVKSCTPSQGNSPYQRSFCMATCASDGDCRGGYSCLDLSGKLDSTGKPTNTLGAVLAEGSGSGKVCGVKPLAAPPLETYDDGDGGLTQSNGVCLGTDAGIGGGSSSDAGGTGGAPPADGGAAGDGGAGG